MDKDDNDTEGAPALVSVRTMEIAVALAFLAGAAVVIFDSVRIGYGWQEGVGPAAGYFPFYVALIMGGSSLVILASALLDRTAAAESFVSTVEFRRVLAVLVPSIVFVGAIHVLGIYVAAAIFIAFFMIAFGQDTILKSTAVGIAVPLALFFMFERWFLVPLPKGPLEAALGY